MPSLSCNQRDSGSTSVNLKMRISDFKPFPEMIVAGTSRKEASSSII